MQDHYISTLLKQYSREDSSAELIFNEFGGNVSDSGRECSTTWRTGVTWKHRGLRSFEHVKNLYFNIV